MNNRYNFVGDLLTTDKLPSNPNLGDVYKIDDFFYVWSGDGWAVSSEETYNYENNITFLGKLDSTDLLPKYPDLGDTYEIDTFFYSWNTNEWVVSSNESSKFRSINVMESETVVGPAGPPGDVWVPAVDTFGNLSWTKNVGTIPPIMVNIKGDKGDSGVRGPQGPSGPVGPQGIIGPAGPKGVAGPQGDRGFVGPQGPVGLTGATGARGPQGISGPKGDTGSRGLIGQQGPRGYGIDVKLAGTTVQFKKENEVWGENPEYGYPIDIQGPKGDAGPTGPAGRQGAQGPVGPRGYVGPRGPAGITGQKGAQGEKGETGAGVKIVGEVTSYNELPHTGVVGEAYLFGEGLYIWIPNTASWKLVDGIRGPQGAKGEVGDTIQIYMGTVSAGDEAHAELVWQDGSLFLNMVIPKGDIGPAGPANSITATIESILPSAQAEVIVTGVAPNQNIHFKVPTGKTGAQGVTGARGKDLEYRWVNSDGDPDPVNGRFLQVRQEGGTWGIPKELGGQNGVDGAKGEKGDKGDPINITVTSEELLASENLEVTVSDEFNGSQNIHFKIPKGKDGENGLPGAPGPQGPIGPAGPPGMVDYGLVYTKPEVDDMIGDLQTLTQNPVFKTGIAIDTNLESGISLSGTKITGAPYNGFIHGRTSQYGNHGYVSGIEAIYNTVTGIGNGWIWNASGKNVASLSQDGRFTTDGGLKAYSLDVEDYVKGNFYGDLEGDVLGNATTAEKLLVPVNISMDGGVVGTAEFDGSSDIIINTELTGNIGLIDNINKSILPHEMLEGMYGSVDTMHFNGMPGDGYNNLTLNLNSEDYEVDNTQLGFSRGAIAFRQENNTFLTEDKLDTRIIWGIQAHKVRNKGRLFCFTNNNKYPNGWANIKYVDDLKNGVTVFYDVGNEPTSENTIAGAITKDLRTYVGPAYQYIMPDGQLGSHVTSSTAFSTTDEFGKKVYDIKLAKGTYVGENKFEYDISSDVQVGEKISIICEYELLTNEVPEAEKLSFSLVGGQYELTKPMNGIIGKVEFENVEIKNQTIIFSLKSSALEQEEEQKLKIKMYYVRGRIKPFTTLQVPNGAFAVDSVWNRDTHTFILKNADRKPNETSCPMMFADTFATEYQRISLPNGIADCSVGISGVNNHFVGSSGSYLGSSNSGRINFAISSDVTNNKTIDSPEFLPEYIIVYFGVMSIEAMTEEIAKTVDLTTHGQLSAWNEWDRIHTDTYHPQADKLSNPVKISVVGDVVGELTTDFSNNATINLNVVNDSHLHNETYYTKEESDEINAKNFLNLGPASNLDALYKNGLYTVEKYGGLTSPWVGESEGRIFNITKGGSEYNPEDPTGQSIVQIFVNVDGRIATRNKLESADWSIWNYTYNDQYHPMADKLTTAREINGVQFDGTENITITADPNPHEHSADDVTSGVLPLARGGIGIDGNTLEGYIKRDKYTEQFKSVKYISWHDIIDIPPSIGGNGSGGSGGSGTIELPNASTSTAGIVMLSADINDSSISKAATPYLTNLLNTKHTNLLTAFNQHVATYNNHTHPFNKITIDDLRDIANDEKTGLTRLYSTMTSPFNHEHGAPTLQLLTSELDKVYVEFDNVVDMIVELDEAKADVVHTHNASTDITDGVVPVRFGGTGSLSYSGKYIINQGNNYFSSLTKIPWEDIDVKSDAFAEKVHMHSWSDIYEESIPNAATDPAIAGIVKMTQDWNTIEEDSTLSAYAIHKKMEGFATDAAPKDHNHDDRYRKLGVNLNWQEINKFTVDRAMIGDGEDFQGIVSLSDSLGLDRNDIAATASAVKKLNDKFGTIDGDFAPIDHMHDASHIVSGILGINRGGIGKDMSTMPGGFLKFDVFAQEVISQYAIELDDLSNAVQNYFAQKTHRHVFWDDLDDIPYANATTEQVGLAKITKKMDYSELDSDNVAAHISLVKQLGDQINGFQVDAYTRLESDSKFLGNQGEAIPINLDDVSKISILENNSITQITSQENVPTKTTYGILQTIPSSIMNSQIYFDMNGDMFFRAYEKGNLNVEWKKVTTGAAVDIATYEKAGIFKVNNEFLLKEEDTVPTSSLFVGTIEALNNHIKDTYSEIGHKHAGGDITSAVKEAEYFLHPEIINLTGDVSIPEPFTIYGGYTWDMPITITKKASLLQDGIVQLSQDFEDTSEIKAATINSVSILYHMLTGDSDEVAYVKKSGDTMTGELSVPSILLNNSDLSSIYNGGVSLTLNNGNGQINGANIYHEDYRPTPEDIGAEPAITILPILKGGTGASSLTGKYVLGGQSALTTSNTIPWADLVDVPIASTSEAGIIMIGYSNVDAAPGDHRHNNVTVTTDGFMSFDDKLKLDGIQSGSEVNQNAYSHIQVENDILSATDKMDTFQFMAGENIELTGVGKTMTIKNTYVHPTEDGYKHVPANGTSNNGKFLRASGMAGTYTWSNLPEATTILSGIVKLNNTLTSTSLVEAPTSNALNMLYKMLVNDNDQVAYVKKSGDVMTGELSTPSIFLNNSDASSIHNSNVSLTLNNGNGQINGANIYHENYRPSPEDLGAEPAITILPIAKGGTGSSVLDGKYVLGGQNELTTSNTIPWLDIVNVPIASTTEQGIIKIGYGSTDAAPGDHRHNNVTTLIDGFMSSQDKSKIDGIQSGAEVNQNSYSTIMVESTAIQSTSKTDTFQFIAGENIELTSAGKSMTIKNTYVHPTNDGSKHVPANGVANNGKFLMSSSVAGIYTWSDLPTATTAISGIVKLNDTLTSTSLVEAPTSNALNKIFKMLTEDDPTVAYVKKSGDIMYGNLTLPKIILSDSTSAIVNSSGANIVECIDNETIFGTTNGKTTIASSTNPVIKVISTDYEIFHEGRLPDINLETSGVALVSKGGTGTASFEHKYIIKSSEEILSSIAKIPWADVDVELDEDGNIVPPGGGGNGGFVPAEHTHPWSEIESETIPKASSALGFEGIVALTNSTTSTSITTAATPNSVKLVNENANSKVSKAGDVMTGSLTATSLIANDSVTAKFIEFGGARIVFNTTDQSIDFIID